MAVTEIYRQAGSALPRLIGGNARTAVWTASARKRVKDLEADHGKRKRMSAEIALDVAAMRDFMGKNG